MNIKMLFFGTTSIVVTIVIIAMLGVMYNFINDLSGTITGTNEVETNSMSATYCSKTSDCKQNPNDCTQCVNILYGGFTILNKCNDNPLKCSCVDNKCTT